MILQPQWLENVVGCRPRCLYLWQQRGAEASPAIREGSVLIRLGVVDDHPIFRLGLIRCLEREADLKVVWEVGSLEEFHAMLESAPVDVVLMDLRLGPGEDPLAAVREVRERLEVKVIIISASLDWEAAAAARAAGASGYLPKDLSIADMVAAIRGLSSPNFGRWAFNDMLTARYGPAGRYISVSRRLSKREQQVLSELRKGYTNKEIAARLSVSTTTVNKHVQQILKKLEVRTRTQAVALVSDEVAGRSYAGTAGH